MRRSCSVLAACLLASLVGAVPGSEAAPAPAGPTESAVRGGCAGGAGRVSLTLSQPDADGTVRFVVVATHLPDGARWVGSVLATDGEGEDVDARDFRRDSADGGWTVNGRLELGDYEGPGTYQLIALERPVSVARSCSVGVFEGRSQFGLANCSSRVFQALGVRHNGDELVLRYFQSARPESTWALELRAIGADHSTSVTIDDRTSPRGLLATRFVLEGVRNPRLFVMATGENGRRCALGLNLPDVGNTPLPTPAEMAEAARQVRQRVHDSASQVG